jgi:hypothetical protein
MPPEAAAAPPAGRRHLILSLARPEAYVPMTRSILGRIGYAIVSPSEWQTNADLAGVSPGLCLVDERQLTAGAELPPVPLVVLCGKGPVEREDRRVVGVVAKPAGLHELYRLFQQALEPIARAHLRALTNLPVRLRRDGRAWHGALLSLSENGCLVRSAEPLELGTELEVGFELPRAGWIETKAETSYRLVPDTGLVFQATPPASRRAILSFVEELLAA